MDTTEFNEYEAIVWRQTLNEPIEFLRLIAFCHNLLTGENFDSICWYPNASQILATASSRASQDISYAMDTHNNARLFEAVAHLAVALGSAFRGGDTTAFAITKLLLGAAGFTLDANEAHARHQFLDFLHSKRPLALTNLFDQFWSFKSAKYV